MYTCIHVYTCTCAYMYILCVDVHVLWCVVSSVLARWAHGFPCILYMYMYMYMCCDVLFETCFLCASELSTWFSMYVYYTCTCIVMCCFLCASELSTWFSMYIIHVHVHVCRSKDNRSLHKLKIIPVHHNLRKRRNLFTCTIFI